MQSAEEFYISISAMDGSPFIKAKDRPNACISLIRARDREIVELVGEAYVNMDMPCIPEEHRNMVRIAIQERIHPILDSVLRDLG